MFNLLEIPDPVSPIDEMLLEFANELKPEQIPDFGPQFYNNLFQLFNDRIYEKPRVTLRFVFKKPMYNLRNVRKKKKIFSI
jgi:hypothetical protein